MSNLVYDALVAHLPARRRRGSEWTSFTAPCCIHNGETPDRRGRGGIKLNGDAAVYSCFNCSYKAVHRTGDLLTNKMRNALSWMGMSDEALKKLYFNTWQIKQRAQQSQGIPLPTGSQSIADLVQQNCQDADFLAVHQWLQANASNANEFYWTPDQTNNLHQSAIEVRETNGRVWDWSAYNLSTGEIVGPKGLEADIDDSDYWTEAEWKLHEAEFDAQVWEDDK